MSTSFGPTTTAAEVTAGLDLTGKTVLVTGANSGIGLETARVVAAAGAHVIGTGRTVDKAQAGLDGIAGPGGVTAIACELSDPASAKAAAAAVVALGRRLDAVVCNAGIMALPKLEVKHGLELQFLTNHLGHFIFVTGLLDALSDAGRVVVVSSMAHENAPPEGIDFDNLDGSKSYSPFRAYGQSKTANILFARSLSRRFAGTARVANAVHPGVIKTNLTRHMADQGEGIFTRLKDGIKTIPQGAATQTVLAIHPSTAKVTGEYWSDCQPAEMSPMAKSDDLADRLWAKSDALTQTLTG